VANNLSLHGVMSYVNAAGWRDFQLFWPNR